MTEWSAWYSGDTEALRNAYSGAVGAAPRRWYRFWSRIAAEPTAQKAELHVPIAGDLAAVSGALLFGETPTIRVPQAHLPKASRAAKAAEERLRDILEDTGAYNRFVEAAESASAMGGAYLFPAWDRELVDAPIPALAQADQAIPQFKHGFLQSVILWRILEEDGEQVLRHLELHRPADTPAGKAYVINAVYNGTKQEIGNRLPDTEVQARGMTPLVEFPFPGLDVEYIPNMRPNRLWRNSGLGLSDFSGSEGMFDALDEVYASWMRDIRLAKARIIVPRDFIDESGSIDIDHEVYQPMNMEPGATEAGARSMLAQQFEIRYLEHRETAIELVERIVSNSGYSPQTFGIRIEGRAESGTALRLRESKTLLTLKRKGAWWRPAIARLFEHIMAIDAEVFGGPGLGDQNTVEAILRDGIPVDPTEVSQTVAQLNAAQAASIETRVRIVHPEWSKEEVDAEVKRIKDELKPAPATTAPAGPSPQGMAMVTDPQTGEAGPRTARNIANEQPKP